MTRVLQIAPEIAPGSGVGGVAYHLEQELRKLGFDVDRFTMKDAYGSWLPQPGPGLSGRLTLFARVVWFSMAGTILARHRLRGTFPATVAICHNDVLAGDIYVNHGILRAAMKARGNYILRMLRNPLHLFTSLRDSIRYRSRAHRIVVSLTSHEADLISKFYPRMKADSAVISNGVDIERFTPATVEQRVRARAQFLPASNDPQTRYLLFVGHEFERKGLPLVISALPDLPAEVQLLVVGGTPEMLDSAAGMALKAGVLDRVHLLGRMANPVPAFHAADCFILPSAYEANALVILEALASGLPVVTSPVGYAPDIIREGANGFLVARTPDSVRDGIRRYLDADPATLTRAARAAAEGHSWECIAKKYAELLTDLVGSPRESARNDNVQPRTS